MSLSTTSKHFLDTYRDSDPATNLGSPLQHQTTFSENKFFLISNLNLPWCSLKLSPLVLSAFCLLALLGAALLVLLEKGQAVFPLSAWSCRGQGTALVAHTTEIQPIPC